MISCVFQSTGGVLSARRAHTRRLSVQEHAGLGFWGMLGGSCGPRPSRVSHVPLPVTNASIPYLDLQVKRQQIFTSLNNNCRNYKQGVDRNTRQCIVLGMTARQFTPEQKARMKEWSSKGGKAGSSEDKRRACLVAWANPNPKKRPGRKKGSRNRPHAPSAPTPIQATTGSALGADFDSVMRQLLQD